MSRRDLLGPTERALLVNVNAAVRVGDDVGQDQGGDAGDGEVVVRVPMRCLRGAHSQKSHAVRFGASGLGVPCL
eukprot:2579649-Pyramimonas_sp.AAC.1